jgi:hypothetical protein
MDGIWDVEVPLTLLLCVIGRSSSSRSTGSDLLGEGRANHGRGTSGGPGETKPQAKVPTTFSACPGPRASSLSAPLPPLPIDRKLIQFASPTRQNSHIILGDHENKEVGDASYKDVTTTFGILCPSCIRSVSSSSRALSSSRNMAMNSCLSQMCRAAR